MVGRSWIILLVTSWTLWKEVCRYERVISSLACYQYPRAKGCAFFLRPEPALPISTSHCEMTKEQRPFNSNAPCSPGRQVPHTPDVLRRNSSVLPPANKQYLMVNEQPWQGGDSRRNTRNSITTCTVYKWFGFGYNFRNIREENVKNNPKSSLKPRGLCVRRE